MGAVGTLGQLKLGVGVGVGTDTEAAGAAAAEIELAMGCCGRSGADGQVNSGGFTVENGASTSGADKDAGIDPSVDAGVGAGEGTARNAEAAVTFVGNDLTDFVGERAASAPEAALFAASAAAAAPKPFHVPIEGTGDSTGL